MTRITLTLLGTFEATIDGQSLVGFPTDKVRALLAYLAVESERSHRRDSLAALLWPELSQKAALSNLRKSLYHLRHTFNKEAPETADSLLTITRQTIQLNATHLTVDVATFRNLIIACESHDHRNQPQCDLCQARLAEAVLIYQGEFLAGFGLADALPFEEWLLTQREALAQQVLLGLSILAAAHEQRRDYEPSLAFASRLLAMDPYRENANRQLMRILALMGRRVAALQQYETCRQVLREGLGVAPEEATVTLYEQIKAGEFDRQTLDPIHDFGGMPATSAFYGRIQESAQLRQWLAHEQCRFVIVLGIGGVGKTSLASQAVRQVADQFEFVIWRSLLNAPPADEITAVWLQTLSHHTLHVLPESNSERLNHLLKLLKKQRCLLILDNVESIMQPGKAGEMRPGYKPYAQLFHALATSEHQSSLLLTSRERPRIMGRLQNRSEAVQTLTLTGLKKVSGQAILTEHGIRLSSEEATSLIHHYSGNPLALQIVADTIRDFFDGNFNTFQQQDASIFDDIRVVLDQQFSRLSQLEQAILLWLAIEREAVTAAQLRQNLQPKASPTTLLESLHGLQRRSLLEKHDHGFTLQNVVMEYVTDYLIAQVCPEIESGQLNTLRSHALLRAQAKTYVQHSQTRLILQPLIEQLESQLGKRGLTARIQQIIIDLQAQAAHVPSYAAGNLLNILLQMGIDLTGYDFSQLSIWQASLSGENLPEVNFALADFRGTVFTERFWAINAVAFSPDGQILAAGDSRGGIYLWQVKDWQPIGLLPGHKGAIESIAFSPDGQLLASGGHDNIARISHVPTGQLCQTLKGHRRKVMAVTFSPDGTAVATASYDHTIRTWDVETGQTRHLLQEHSRAVWGVAYSPDGSVLVSSSEDRTIRVWDGATGELLHVLSVPRSVIMLTVSPDGSMVAGGSWDRAVRVWDTRNWQIRHTLQGHERAVRSVAFSPDNQWLASSDEDSVIHIWDVHDSHIVRTWNGQFSLTSSVAFSPDGVLLASGNWDQTVRIWTTDSGQPRHVLSGYTSKLWDADFSPDRTMLASGGEDALIRLWNVHTGQMICTLAGHTGNIANVAFSPNSKLLASSSWDQTVQIWDIDSQQAQHILCGHIDQVGVIEFSPDGQLLASGSDDHRVMVWEVASGRLLHTFEHHNTGLTTLAFSPNGRFLASRDGKKAVSVVDLETETISYTLSKGIENATPIRVLGFSADGQLLICTVREQTVQIVDVFRRKTVSTLQVNDDTLTRAQFSQDGSLIASSSTDQTIHVWDVFSGQCIHTLQGHDNSIISLKFSNDKMMLVSTSLDETIKLWDMQTGSCQQTLRVAGPYAGMNISDVTGVSEAQKSVLISLGAVG